jgi:hypothetical protein
MPTPLANTDYKEFDLEISWCRPPAKHFKDSLLDILVLHGRTLWALKPADDVFHLVSLIADCKKGPTDGADVLDVQNGAREPVSHRLCTLE